MPHKLQTWYWYEAFDKFGFNDGNDEIHTEDVMAVLEELGWKVGLCDTVHNRYIGELDKGSVHVEIEGHEEDDELRKLLPADVVEALDKDFPQSPQYEMLAAEVEDKETAVSLIVFLTRKWKVKLSELDKETVVQKEKKR